MVLAAVSLTLAATSCGGKVDRAPSNASAEPPLATFAFPSDGVPNDNGYVGPFCCTGRTGVVKDAKGAAIGYSYFYSSDGGLNLSDQQSVAAGFSILVAGHTNLADAGSPLVTSQIAFATGELEMGVTKSAVAGALEFDVTIDHVDIVPVRGQSYFDMGTLAVTVAVRPASERNP
jgi:hypothetical protein